MDPTSDPATTATRLDDAGSGGAVPVLRILDEQLARTHYLDGLGFAVEWEHRFAPGMPLYVRIRRGATTLDLSAHHGDGTPGAVVWVPVRSAQALLAEIAPRLPSLRPGIDQDAPGGPTLEVTDPFGNVVRFCEPRG